MPILRIFPFPVAHKTGLPCAVRIFPPTRAMAIAQRGFFSCCGFFLIWSFFKINLVTFNYVSSVGVTYEGVTLVHMVHDAVRLHGLKQPEQMT
jgi:hypothetical protein